MGHVYRDLSPLMGVLRGLGRVVGGLLAGVWGLLRGVVEGLGRLLRRLF